MFCPNCGTQVPEGANACPNCGTFLKSAQPAPETPVYQAPVQQPVYQAAPVYNAAPVQDPVYQIPSVQQPDNYQVASSAQRMPLIGIKKPIHVFLLISTILMAICTCAISLSWCLPMKNSYWRYVRNGQSVPVGLKVCTLIFISRVAGILMLCDHS